MEYEARYFATVTNGGFYDQGDTGTSPDGNVSTDGLVEAKSAIASAHFERIQGQSFDYTYKWQLAGHLKFSGRDWVDFISYCSSFPEGKKIYVHRSDRDSFKDEFKMIDERMYAFRKLIEEAKDVILNNNYSIIGE